MISRKLGPRLCIVLSAYAVASTVGMPEVSWTQAIGWIALIVWALYSDKTEIQS